MKENIISFETAKVLKIKGFNEPCSYHYDESGKLKKDDKESNYNANVAEFSAPTLWDAQKWLRDKKFIHISIEVDFEGYTFSVSAKDEDDMYNEYSYYHKIYDTYEECLDHAIAEALEHVFFDYEHNEENSVKCLYCKYYNNKFCNKKKEKIFEDGLCHRFKPNDNSF